MIFRDSAPEQSNRNSQFLSKFVLSLSVIHICTLVSGYRDGDALAAEEEEDAVINYINQATES